MKNYAQILQDLLAQVEAQGASDLHLAAGRVPYLRVNGELIPLLNKSILEPADTFGILKEIVDQKKVERVVNLEEIDFAYAFGNMRLRGSAYIESGSIAIALRAIQKVRSLEELHLPDVLRSFAEHQQGFFLVVGPVGQGKTTTMAAMVDLINSTRKEHIVTIENPVEYVFEQKNSIIDQREIGIDTKTFEDALTSVFRQDVNVIMIGEMRNPETIATAVTAAETGHLVLSTLHTNNASQTIDRIVDSFPGNQQDQIRAQLASTLIGIFSQRLVPSTRGGLVPAYELMINTKATANLIREGRTHEIDTVIETGSGEGMIDMNRSLIELVRSGDITLEDARSYSLNPKAFESLIA